MEGQHASGGGEPDAGAERELRLMALLRDVVADKGRIQAADLLGVNYKTLKRVLESGRLTPLVRDALERFRLPHDGAGAAIRPERVGALERRIDRIEGRLTTLAREQRATPRRPEVSGDGPAASRAEARPAAPRETSEPSAGEPAAVAGMRSRAPVPPRRPFPEVVTADPGDDDAEAYGEAWPLVEEWRHLRSTHPEHGVGVRWLKTEARLLVLELALLEDHGLTLPPETQPLRGFARRGQTTWRRTALRDTQGALARAKLRRWIRGALTFGLWWR